jgi:hypothetical protein
MVIVKLAYESRDGKSIPIPENHPDEIRLDDLNDPHQVTDNMVAAIVAADLKVHGVTHQDVVISWTAFNDLPDTTTN